MDLEGGEGNGTPLQYSCLENLMDGGAWWAAVHGVAKSQTRLSNFTFTFHFHTLEKEMATHSSALAWRIPGMEEPDGLPSMGSHRVGAPWFSRSMHGKGLQENPGTDPVITANLPRITLDLTEGWGGDSSIPHPYRKLFFSCGFFLFKLKYS